MSSTHVIPSRRRGISSMRTIEIPRRVAPRNDTGVIPNQWRGISILGSATVVLAGMSTTAYAQAPAPEGPSLLPLILTFVFVLALIPVAVWMLKRLGAGNPAS